MKQPNNQWIDLSLAQPYPAAKDTQTTRLRPITIHRRTDKIINQKELRVIGMSRSGNHAILNWIIQQAEGRTCFLNCAEGKTNPFITARPLHHGRPYEVSYPDFHWERERNGHLSPKDLLLHSYEDSFLGYVCHSWFEQNHDRWIGPSRQRTDLLILRDPFNLFASRQRAQLSAITPKTALRIWKQHARAFLAPKRLLRPQPILINYNRWAINSCYRRQIATQLGLRFTDAGINTVHRTGGGSSFDGIRYNGQATKVRVLDRWKVYQDDPAYWQLSDAETIQLSHQIFGLLPGLGNLASQA